MKRTTVELASASPGRPPLRCCVVALEQADCLHPHLQLLSDGGCNPSQAVVNSGDTNDDVGIGAGSDSPVVTGLKQQSMFRLPLPPSLAGADRCTLPLQSTSDNPFDLEALGVDVRLSAHVVVVCFWNGGCKQAHEIANWLRSHGVSVEQHHGKQQLGASCAIVAARVAVMLRSCASLCRVDLSDAVSEVHIVEANAAFRFFSERRLQREPAATRFLSTSDCHTLITYWSGVDPFRYGKDHHWVKFVSYDEMAFVLGAWLKEPPAKSGRMMFVCNTETAGKTGEHFFVVALSW